jgi:putative addiction module component (TIGR02574 family)
MTETEQVLTNALKLAAPDRARVVEQLIASLDAESDPEVELAWQQEIQRRLGEIDRGEVVCVPWEEVRDRLRQSRRASA